MTVNFIRKESRGCLSNERRPCSPSARYRQSILRRKISSPTESMDSGIHVTMERIAVVRHIIDAFACVGSMCLLSLSQNDDERPLPAAWERCEGNPAMRNKQQTRCDDLYRRARCLLLAQGHGNSHARSTGVVRRFAFLDSVDIFIERNWFREQFIALQK